MKKIIQLVVTILFVSTLITSSYAYYGEPNTQSQMVHTTLNNCDKKTVTLTFQKIEIGECQTFQAKEYSQPQSSQPSSNVRAVQIQHTEQETPQKEITTLEQNVKFGVQHCNDCDDNTTVYEMTSSAPHNIEKDNSKQSVVGTIVTYVQECFW